MLKIEEAKKLAQTYYERLIEWNMHSAAELEGKYKTTLTFPLYDKNGVPTNIENKIQPILNILKEEKYTVKAQELDGRYRVDISWEDDEDLLFNE